MKALLLLEGSGLSLLASTTASPAGVPEALSPAQSASEADRLNEAMGGILPLKEWSYSTTLGYYSTLSLGGLVWIRLELVLFKFSSEI